VFPTTREGFGIAVLEAIACGLPVVTTSAPDNLAQYLVARSSAGVVCAPAAAAIADALRTLLAQLDERPAEIPAVQDAWLTDHSWDAAADRVGQALGLWEQDDSAIPDDLSVRGDAAAGQRA
jgi:glycosyltransferase involved in cell wall biosynthesis